MYDIIKRFWGDKMKKENVSKILLLIAAMIWGSGFPATKIILNSGIKTFEFLALRFLTVGIIMVIYFNFIRGEKIKKSELKIGGVSGILLMIAFSLQTLGMVYTTSAKNAFITGANVVFTPFVVWFLGKTKPRKIYYLSSVICFIGIGVISLKGDFRVNKGDFLTLLCAISFAFQIAYLGINLKDENPMKVNSIQMLMVGILTLMMNIAFEKSSIFTRNFSLTQIIAIGYLIVFNTFICYSIQTYSQKVLEPSKVSLILTSEILFGAIFSVILLREKLDIRVVLGGILIIVSIILTELKYFSKDFKSDNIKK